jgi:hypothetical protein
MGAEEPRDSRWRWFRVPGGRVRPFRRVGRWRGGVPLLLAIALLLAACAGDDDDDLGVTEVAGIPVLGEHTSGAGAELGDGFTVVDGTVLLGDVVPTGADVEFEGRIIEDRGWRAMLLVTGDAETVLDAYAGQAADMDLPLTDPYGGRGCLDDRSGVVSCARRGQAGSDQDVRSVQIELERAPASDGRAPLSHLTIDYTETGEPPYPPRASDTCPSYICRTVAPPPVPTEWPPLPKVGQPYETDVGQVPGRVEPGSHLVAHPASPFGIASLALFVVTGHPEDVLDRYAHQQETRDVFEERRRDDGATVLERSWRAGGGEYDASAVIRDDHPIYLLLEHLATD